MEITSCIEYQLYYLDSYSIEVSFYIITFIKYILFQTIVDQDLVIIMDGLVETFVLSYHVDPEFEDFVENGTLLLRASQPFIVYVCRDK